MQAAIHEQQPIATYLSQHMEGNRITMMDKHAWRAIPKVTDVLTQFPLTIW